MSGPIDTPAEARPEPRQRWRVLAVVECGNFLVYMDAFIVTLALPALSRHFGVGLREVRWVMIAYLATLTVTLLLGGRLADLWGRQRLTIAGMALLTLGAGLCSLAANVGELIAYRVIQGLGGALVLANVMAAITSVFPPSDRPRAMAINATVLAMGQITALVFGGFLLGSQGWSAIFVFLAAMGGLGLVLDLAVLRRPPIDAAASMDWWGALLSVLVIGSPFLVIEAFAQDMGGPTGGLFVLVAAALLGLFVFVEKRSAQPLLEVGLFRIRPFICGSIAAALYFVAATSCYFLLPLYAQFILGLPPLTAGLLLVPLSVALTATSQLVGRLSSRFGARTVSTAGLLCTSTAILLLSTLGPSATYAEIIGPVVLVGIGGGLFHPPNNTSVLNGVPRAHLSAANGFFTMARNLGQALGVALAAAFLDHGLGAGGMGSLAGGADSLVTGPALSAYVEGQALAYRVAAALGLAGAVISALRGAAVTPAPHAAELSLDKAAN